LDLLVVCVEAGLGLDQALVNVSRELEMTHKDISDELRLVNLEMQAGKRRADALRNLADRTGEAEIRKLTAILIQTDRFGTSMADALRTHSDYMRLRRRQEPRRAAKVSVEKSSSLYSSSSCRPCSPSCGGSGVLRSLRSCSHSLRQLRGGMIVLYLRSYRVWTQNDPPHSFWIADAVVFVLYILRRRSRETNDSGLPEVGRSGDRAMRKSRLGTSTLFRVSATPAASLPAAAAASFASNSLEAGCAEWSAWCASA
jgi:hypothetical protein